MGHLPARLPDLLNQQRSRARHAKVVPDEPTGALVDGFLGLEYAAARLQRRHFGPELSRPLQATQPEQGGFLAHKDRTRVPEYVRRSHRSTFTWAESPTALASAGVAVAASQCPPLPPLTSPSTCATLRLQGQLATQGDGCAPVTAWTHTHPTMHRSGGDHVHRCGLSHLVTCD